MFGVLKPALGHVSAENKQLYHSTYCNLCASLSASGAGVFNRFFLINDVVTIDWLLTEEEKSSQHAFACTNCVKGGVIGNKDKITSHQKLLAAISTFVCGVKINDNALDNPKLKNKSLALLYRPIMKKAKAQLEEFNVLDKLQTFMTLDRENENHRIKAIDRACEPTEKCYEIMTVEISKTHSTLPQSTVELLGRYLGRCVYLLDAIQDMDEDLAKNQYNVLNLIASDQKEKKTKQSVISTCLNFLKPMRLEITEKLRLIPDSLTSNSLRRKWDSLFFSIEDQLATLIRPLNDNCLVSLLSSFSPKLEGGPLGDMSGFIAKCRKSAENHDIGSLVDCCRPGK